MRTFSKVAMVLTACALAFGLFGCAGDKQTTNKATEATIYKTSDVKVDDISIEQSGYTITTTDNIDAEGNTVKLPSVDFAFIVKNPNSGYVAYNVPFTVAGYDDEGTIIFSGSATCMYIYPGIETAISGSTIIADAAKKDKITQFKVEPLMTTAKWLDTSLSDADIAKIFTVNNAKAERIDDMVTIMANVTGDLKFADKVYSVVEMEKTLEGHCVAVFYDKSGNIIFGSDSTNVLIDQETLDNAKASDGGEVLDNISIPVENAPEYDSFKLFVMPSL